MYAPRDESAEYCAFEFQGKHTLLSRSGKTPWEGSKLTWDIYLHLYLCDTYTLFLNLFFTSPFGTGFITHPSPVRPVRSAIYTNSMEYE